MLSTVLPALDNLKSLSLCSVFNLNNKNVNTLIARESSGFTYTRSLKNDLEIFNTALGKVS